MARALKPGGQLLILVVLAAGGAAAAPVYDAYSFQVLPRLGQLIAGDADSYRYLAESIRKHPDQQTLLQMMRSAGLEDCSYTNLSGGIVARAPRQRVLAFASPMITERIEAVLKPPRHANPPARSTCSRS